MLLFPPIEKRAHVVKTMATKVGVVLRKKSLQLLTLSTDKAFIRSFMAFSTQILNKPSRLVDIVSESTLNDNADVDERFALWRM